MLQGYVGGVSWAYYLVELQQWHLIIGRLFGFYCWSCRSFAYCYSSDLSSARTGIAIFIGPLPLPHGVGFIFGLGSKN
jgi:hypothetical protein